MEHTISQITEQLKQLNNLDLTNEEIVQLEDMREILNEIISNKRADAENPDDPLVYYE